MLEICCAGITQRGGGAVRKLLCESLCACQQGISGADDEELFREVLAHLSRDHPAMPFSEDRVREFVTIRAYNLEYAAVYGDGEGSDEEFGP
jgi:predicted small metal-binding protein